MGVSKHIGSLCRHLYSVAALLVKVPVCYEKARWKSLSSRELDIPPSPSPNCTSYTSYDVDGEVSQDVQSRGGFNCPSILARRNHLAWCNIHLQKLLKLARKIHLNIRTLHSGTRAQDNGDSRNHGLQDPFVYAVFWTPTRAWLGHFVLGFGAPMQTLHRHKDPTKHDFGEILVFMWAFRPSLVWTG